MPQFRQITLTLPDSTLPPLILTKSVEGGNWYKRAKLGLATIGGRTIKGIPKIVANSDYFVGQVVTLVSEAEWTVFEEIQNAQAYRYDALQDGHIMLKDEYHYCTFSETTKNSRAIVSGSTVETGVAGFPKSFCQYPVYIEIPEDHLPYDGGNDWWPLSFSFQELP